MLKSFRSTICLWRSFPSLILCKGKHERNLRSYPYQADSLLYNYIQSNYDKDVIKYISFQEMSFVLTNNGLYEEPYGNA